MSRIADKEIKRWRKVANSCTHSQLTERIDSSQVCFCAKLAKVICINAGCTSMEMSEQIRDLALKEITETV